MLQTTTTFRIWIFLALLLGSLLTHAQGIPMTWKDAAGTENQATVRSVTAESEGRQLLFLAFESAIAGLKSAGYLEEGVGDETAMEELPVIPVKERAGKKYLFLWRKAGKVKTVSEDGTNTIFTYELSPVASSLQLSPSCRQLQFKVKTVTQDTASFPAMIYCSVKNNIVEEMTFSTLEDAEWFGSAAFENAGKGERWKSYVYKDVATLGIWELSWGDPNAKAIGKVLIPKTNKKIPIPPKPALTFMVGVQYLSGKATKSPKEADLAGIQIPLSVQYQKDGSWLFLGSGYDLLVFPTTQPQTGSNSLSNLGVWGGAELKLSNLGLRGSLGYASRAMTAGDVGMTSTFEAPRLGLDLHYTVGESLTGLEVVTAQTSSDGSFEEMTATLFYQRRLLFSKETRFQFQNTAIKASYKGMDVEASWMTLGVLIQF